MPIVGQNSISRTQSISSLLGETAFGGNGPPNCMFRGKGIRGNWTLGETSPNLLTVGLPVYIQKKLYPNRVLTLYPITYNYIFNFLKPF